MNTVDLAVQKMQEKFIQDQYDLIVELTYLLRQIYFARGPLGTKFCDELEQWKLEDLEGRIIKALNS